MWASDVVEPDPVADYSTGVLLTFEAVPMLLKYGGVDRYLAPFFSLTMNDCQGRSRSVAANKRIAQLIAF